MRKILFLEMHDCVAFRMIDRFLNRVEVSIRCSAGDCVRFWVREWNAEFRVGIYELKK